ncbi:MAG: M81 family metallopeptidase [Candidatus Hydrogenedentota bacterium]
MRIGIAGFLHESNTFAGQATRLRHFEEAALHEGGALLPVWREAHHELGGFIAGCEEAGAEAAPLLAAWATPMGPLTDETYEALAGRLCNALREAGPIDGLLLALHGAMGSESRVSADSETLRRVRAVTGPELPIVVSLDMHANIAPDMVRLPTATLAYTTYPHVDQRERGLECARLLVRTVRGEVRPVQAHVKLPLLIHIVQQYTGAGPMAAVMGAMRRLGGEGGMLAASVAPGYIYADTPHMGVSVLAVADGDQHRANQAAEELASFVWARRDKLNAALPDVKEAVRRAAETPGVVCLMDSGDNIGAGSPGDSTLLFEEVRRQGLRGACVVLCDPEAALQCAEAGEGAPVTLAVGGKTDAYHGAPATVQGTVVHVSDGRFVEPEARHGGLGDGNQGRTAVIKTSGGHTVILNSLRIMPTSLEQLLSLGVDPVAHRFVIVKGVTAPLAAYGPIASAVIAVDSPGASRAGPESYTYTQRPKPLYPLEDAACWESPL